MDDQMRAWRDVRIGVGRAVGKARLGAFEGFIWLERPTLQTHRPGSGKSGGRRYRERQVQ